MPSFFVRATGVNCSDNWTVTGSWPYTHAQTYGAGRPPILGMLAVTGMVVAALSTVASLLTAGYGAGIYLHSAAARDRFLRNAPEALPVASPAQQALLMVPLVTPVGPRGLGPVQRQALTDAIGQKIQMAPEQAQQLDALLAEDGGEIFGAPAGELPSAQSVLQAIGEHVGLLPATGSDSADPFFFETPAGRTEVFTNRALFYRKHSVSPVRATAGRRSNVSGHPVLLPQDVNALAGLAQEACGRSGTANKMMGDAQLQTLRTLLSEPRQQLVSVVAGPEGPAVGINRASVGADGYATVEFTGGPLLLAPAGNVVLRSDRNAFLSVSGAACALVIIEGFLSIALAVFLLVLSIRLLNRPTEKLGAFAIYAWAKILSATVGAVAVAWMVYTFLVSDVRVGHRTGSALPVALIAGAAVLVAGVALPIVFLVLPRRRNIREFYEG